MAQSTGPSINIKPCKTFGGRADDDFLDFVSDFERMADGKRWSEADRCQYLPMFLEGMAADEWHKQSDDMRQNYRELIHLFRAKYAPPELAGVYCSELHAAKQGDDESVLDFAGRIQKLGQRGYPDLDSTQRESILKESFLAGLRADLGLLVRLQRPRTMNEAIQAGRQIDCASKLGNSSAARRTGAPMATSPLSHLTQNSEFQQRQLAAGQSAPTPISNEPSASGDNAAFQYLMTRQLTELQNQLASLQMNQQHPDSGQPRGNPANRSSWTEDGRPICFNCNRPGHVARSCTARRQDNRGYQNQGRGRPRYDNYAGGGGYQPRQQYHPQPQRRNTNYGGTGYHQQPQPPLINRPAGYGPSNQGQQQLSYPDLVIQQSRQGQNQQYATGGPNGYRSDQFWTGPQSGPPPLIATYRNGATFSTNAHQQPTSGDGRQVPTFERSGSGNSPQGMIHSGETNPTTLSQNPTPEDAEQEPRIEMVIDLDQPPAVFEATSTNDTSPSKNDSVVSETFHQLPVATNSRLSEREEDMMTEIPGRSFERAVLMPPYEWIIESWRTFSTSEPSAKDSKRLRLEVSRDHRRNISARFAVDRRPQGPLFTPTYGGSMFGRNPSSQAELPLDIDAEFDLQQYYDFSEPLLEVSWPSYPLPTTDQYYLDGPRTELPPIERI